MTKNNVIPKISLIIVLAIVAYFLLFMTMARPAPSSYGEEIDWEIAAITFVLPIAFFSAYAIGLWRAYTAKDYIWLVLQLSFFPMTYIYTLLVNKGLGANNSFNPKPLRSSKMRH